MLRKSVCRHSNVLLLIGFVSLHSTSGYGGELTDLSLDQLMSVKIVSATQREEKKINLPASVVVISGDALQYQGADNLAQVLSQVSSVLVRSQPGDFPMYSTAIRGNSSDFMSNRTLIMIDGVPVFNPNSGFDPSWIPVSVIERVEIVKGPASALYGANAFGGVINVITRSGSKFADHSTEIQANLRYTSYPVESTRRLTTSPSLSLGGIGEGWQYFFSGQVSHEPDALTYTGNTNLDAFGKATIRATENIEVTVSSLFSSDQNQIAVANSSEPVENKFVHLSTVTKYKPHQDLEVNLKLHLNTFRHYLDYTDALDSYENEATSYGATAQVSAVPFSNHFFLAGTSVVRDSGLLETKGYDYSTFPPTTSPAGWQDKHQTTYSVYMQDQYTGFGKLFPLIGIRYDKNSLYGHAISPRAGLSFAMNDSVSIYTAVGRAFRAPIFNESYINGFSKIGNPDLKAETATTYEIGLKMGFQATQNQLSFFSENIKKKINLVPSGSFSTYANSREAWIHGVELEGSIAVGGGFRPFYDFTLLNSGDGTGKQLEKTAQRKGIVGAEYSISSWDLRYSVHHEGPAYFANSNPAIASDRDGRVRVPQFTVMNLQASTLLGTSNKITFYLNNFTNRRYKEGFSSFVNQDGLWSPGIALGAILKLQF